MSKNKLIHDTIYDPEKGFTGPMKIYQRLKNLGIKYNDIVNFMQKQSLYQTNKKITKYGSFIPEYPRQQYQIDLIYLENTHLNKARYGLTCIDTFTKIGDCELMKRRNEIETLEAFKKILKRMGQPSQIYHDEGSEFVNKKFKTYCNKNDIKQLTTLRHAPFVETFNKTLKSMLYKYLQASESKTIVNVLPKIINNYNNSYHTAVEMTPVEASMPENFFKARLNIMKKANKIKRPWLKIGDKVRILLKQKTFDKKYKVQWSKNVYNIENIDPPYFILDGLKRKYLRAHLQKINEYEKVKIDPLLEGTREGHLRKIAKNKSDKAPIVLENKKSIAQTRPKRKRKQIDRGFFITS